MTYVKLQLRDLGTLVSVLTEWVADLERLSLLGEPLEELVVDTLLNEDTRSSAACLAVVPAVEEFRTP